MGRGFSNIVYIIITIAIILVAINIITFLFPYILIGVAIFWLYRYIKNRTINRKERNPRNDYKYSNDEMNDIQHNEEGNVIDVEYEEINK